MKAVAELHELIEKELSLLKFNSRPKELYDPIVYSLSQGGKRMRPVLVLMGCNLFSENIDKAIAPALGIEMFHNFTLLHDDIMDNAPLRRNNLTVHNKWNNSIAILSGDAMFVKAVQLVMRVEDPILRPVLQLFNETAIEVCEGQQIDMNFESRNNVSIAEYLNMITLKTAVLLGCSLKVGALVGGASDENARHLYEFGKNMGIAFQLQDDILDVYADPEKFGKLPGGDIVSNKKTFLLLKSLELSHKYMKEELLNWLMVRDFNQQEKITAVRSIYDFLNIRELAKKEIQKYFNKSLEHLKTIKANDNRKVKLQEFAESLMVREI